MSDTQFPKRFGNYILLDKLNSGGMAEVYRAKVVGVEDFQRLMAIKCILPHLLKDEQFTTMFVDEAKLASQLNHANIVQIYELGRSDEQLYIAMELVKGRDLRHVVKTLEHAGTKMPVPIAAYILSKAAEGLAFAHRSTGLDGQPTNLVHRDVSPQNILISYDGEVKVVDFGIAKAEARATETRAGVLKGKFAYMAPEQVIGGVVDQRSDIYALGAVLYEVITQQKLFSGDNDLSVLEKVRAGTIPNFHQVFPEGPADLIEVLTRALMKDADKRYTYASEMAEGLSPLLIQERAIVGSKQAAEFMRRLYADEIAFLEEQVRRYALIGLDDCTNSQVSAVQPTQIVAQKLVKPAIGDATRATTEPDNWDATTDIGQSVSKTQKPPSKQATSEATELFDPSGPNSPMAANLAGTSTGLDAVRENHKKKGRGGAIAAGVVVAVVALGAAVAFTLSPVPAKDQPKPQTTVQAVEVKPPPPPAPEPVAEPAPAPEPTPEPQPALAPAPAPEPQAPRERARSAQPSQSSQYGYVSIIAPGATARIYVDGHSVGYSPLVFYKVRTGKRDIRVVEEVSGADGRSKSMQINVTHKNTKTSPLKLVVKL